MPHSSFDPIPSAARAIRLARRGMAPFFDEGPVGDLERDALVEGMPYWLAERKGWLYLAVNDAWPGLYKVGCTRKGVAQRLAELGGAAMATPWQPMCSWGTYDAHGLEARAHVRCASWLFHGELFRADPAAISVAVNKAIQADRALLLRHLTPFFLPGRLAELLDAASGAAALECCNSSYTS